MHETRSNLIKSGQTHHCQHCGLAFTSGENGSLCPPCVKRQREIWDAGKARISVRRCQRGQDFEIYRIFLDGTGHAGLLFLFQLGERYFHMHALLDDQFEWEASPFSPDEQKLIQFWGEFEDNPPLWVDILADILVNEIVRSWSGGGEFELYATVASTERTHHWLAEVGEVFMRGAPPNKIQ